MPITRHGYTLRLIILWAAFALFSYSVVDNLLANYAAAANPQIDEQAHIAYALDLIANHHWWPDFSQFYLYEIGNPQALAATNYLNHPPTFYWLAKLLDAGFGSLTLLHFRALSIVLMLAAMALYTCIGVKVARSISTSIFYALLPFLLYAHFQMGFYSNDAAALLGGMVVTYASLNWLAGKKLRLSFWLMVIGLMLTSVKLTSFLLVGIYVLVALLQQRQSLAACGKKHLIAGALLIAIAALPYGYMMLHWGSPAPETPGQIILMTPPETSAPLAAGKEWFFAPNRGWIEDSRMNFLPWLANFLANFADQLSVPETTYLPLLVILVCMGYTLLAARRRTALPHHSLIKLSIACSLATLGMLVIHAIFSWSRYQHHGWMIDSFVRYYFPLLGAYGALSVSGGLALTRHKEAI